MCYVYFILFLFVGDKVSVGQLKNYIIPSLKSQERLKFDQDAALNSVIEKEKQQ